MVHTQRSDLYGHKRELLTTTLYAYADIGHGTILCIENTYIRRTCQAHVLWGWRLKIAQSSNTEE